ncbi:pyruvate phosphate dikinase [Erythrobacter sp. SD-21]|nr:pyruvate phosphate dikinase [Erythrobacter sp. SD-21]
MDAGEVSYNFVLALSESENRIDQVMPNSRVALLNLQAVNKEIGYCAI